MTADSSFWSEVIDGTWSAARYSTLGPWTLREGRGGGGRVSAATLSTVATPVDEDQITAAEGAMRDMGQPPLFMVRPEETALDGQLAARGHVVRDPVTIYTCPPDALMSEPIPRVTVFTIWEPLAIMREIWAAGGIGPERVAVMERVPGPKTGFLARHRDKPAGVAFAAIHGSVAMVHAVEVLPHQRRAGMARWIMRAAAFWAAEQQADTLSVICTRANVAANGLYASLGMQAVGQYHYRHLKDGA